MSVSYNGFNEKAITFKTKEKIADNTFVKISENNTVAACSSGDVFCGTVATGDNKYATVLTNGTATVPYSGTAPTLGYCNLVANGGTGVKVSDNGRKCLVTSINTNTQKVTFIY